MYWDQQKCDQFERDGFVLMRSLFSAEEVIQFSNETSKLQEGDDEVDGLHRERERGGAVRQIYLAHRHSQQFKSLSEDARIVEPVKKMLKSEVYIWHSKINVKDAFEGTVWLWHQDYGYWMWDGVEPKLISVMVLLDEATINNGCLLVASGTHKLGRLEHYPDEQTTSYKQWCVDNKCLKECLSEELIQPITGAPGDVLFFDCNLLHGSGHNMSPLSRRTFIIAYNDLGNRPRPVDNPRPDWVVSRKFEPVPSLDSRE